VTPALKPPPAASGFRVTRWAQHRISNPFQATWKRLTLLSLLDQGLLSSSNFVIGICFARWMTAPAYGSFTISFSVFMLVTGIHNALVVDPVAVVGAKDFGGKAFAYLRGAERIHFAACAALSLLGLALSAVLMNQHRELAQAVAAMDVASFAILLASLWRRGCYLRDDAAGAAMGSAAYLATGMVGLFAARHWAWLSPGVPFAIMAACSTMALLVMRWRGSSGDTQAAMGPVLRRNWQYGRWLALSAALVWMAELAYPVLIGMRRGPEPAAAFRAAELLVMPMYQSLSAVVLPLQPWVSRRVGLEGPGFLRAFVAKGVLLVGTLSTLYAVVVSIAAATLVPWLYPSGLAGPVMAALFPMCVWLILRSVHDVVISTGVRAVERTRIVFIASMVGAVLTLSGGVAAISLWGAPGAATARALGTLVQLIILYWGLRQVHKEAA